MALQRKDFIKLAQYLMRVKDNAVSARRFLTLIRRERILRTAIKKAIERARADNPLSEIDFSIPLSVAGQDSLLIVIAEGMIREGVPIAMKLDEKGQHCGTPIDEVRTRLDAIGHQLTDPQIMDAYRQFVLAHPSGDLAQRMMNTSKERRRLQKTLLKALDKYEGRRFMVAMRRQDLVEALAKIPFAPDQHLILGYAGKVLNISGKHTAVITGERSGAAVIWRADLQGVSQIEGEVVALEVHKSQWIAWVSAQDGDKLKEIGPLVYGFPGCTPPED